MNLSFLSLHFLRPTTTVPSVPTNEDRLRALRAALAPEIGNSYPWAFKGARP